MGRAYAVLRKIRPYRGRMECRSVSGAEWENPCRGSPSPADSGSRCSLRRLFERIHRTLPPAVLWELAPNACHGHSIGLGAGLQMAILAGQIVTGKTFRRVRNVGPDLIWRIGEKRVPVFD